MAAPQRPPRAAEERPRPGSSGVGFGVAVVGAIALAVGLLLFVFEPSEVAGPSPSAEPSPGSWRDALARWLEGTRGLEDLRDLVDLAHDPGTALEVRIGAVRWIAREGSGEAIEILEDLLEGDAPEALRVAIAEALGEAKGPEARRLLDALLEGEDEAVARGAVRGLAARADGLAALEAVLVDADRPTPRRAQAAAALGELGSAESSARLRAALAQLDDESLVGSVLDALGAHPFASDSDAFQAVLGNPALPRSIKIQALEAIGDSGGDAARLLLDYATRSPESEVRAAAVEALAFLDDSPQIAAGLLRLVESEPSPEVRAEIYDALSFHARATYAATDPARLVEVILSETGRPPRLQGYRLVASVLREHPDPRLQTAFDSHMLPWLEAEARRAAGHPRRLASLEALGLARTPEARQALARLSRSSDATLAAAAQRALRAETARRELTAN